MSRFIAFSVILHLALFYANIHYKIKGQYEDVMQKHNYKITIIKVKNPPEKKVDREKANRVNENIVKNTKNNNPIILPDKVDTVNDNIVKNIKNNNAIILPDREQFIKTPENKVAIPLLPIKNNYNVDIPYLTPKYSAEKIHSKPSVSIPNNSASDSSYKIKYDESTKKIYKKESSDLNKYILMYRDEVFSIVYRKFEKYIKNKKFKNQTSILNVNINQTGKVLSISFQESSSDEEFNKLCKKVIEDIGEFPPFPKVLEVDVIKLTIPFKVKLP